MATIGHDGGTSVGCSMPTVLIPGSFDPIHFGHLDVIDQAQELFGTVVVGVMHNPSKPSGMFTPDERVELVRLSLADRHNVTVRTFTGLAVDAAEHARADFIVKGLRVAGDFEVEQQMAHNNHALTAIRTVYVPCRPDLGHISSRFVREIASQGRRVDHLVPRPVAGALTDRFGAVHRHEEDT
jgi:pantetheine-phosphate adenylyltransferase